MMTAIMMVTTTTAAMLLMMMVMQGCNTSFGSPAKFFNYTETT